MQAVPCVVKHLWEKSGQYLIKCHALYLQCWCRMALGKRVMLHESRTEVKRARACAGSKRSCVCSRRFLHCVSCEQQSHCKLPTCNLYRLQNCHKLLHYPIFVITDF
jgi:hypothetical protein